METIRTFSGTILGFIKFTGDKFTATTLAGKILGYYNPKTNFTTNFTGEVLMQGNILSYLIIKESKLNI